MIEFNGKKYQRVLAVTSKVGQIPGCYGCAFEHTSDCPTKDKYNEDCCSGPMTDWIIYKEVKDEPEHPSAPD